MLARSTPSEYPLLCAAFGALLSSFSTQDQLLCPVVERTRFTALSVCELRLSDASWIELLIGSATCIGAAAGLSAECSARSHRLMEIESRLLPCGLHVVGNPPTAAEAIATLVNIAEIDRVDNDPPIAGLPGTLARSIGRNVEEIYLNNNKVCCCQLLLSLQGRLPHPLRL